MKYNLKVKGPSSGPWGTPKPSLRDYPIKKTPLVSFEEASFFELRVYWKCHNNKFPWQFRSSSNYDISKDRFNKNGNIKCRQCRLRSIINNAAFYVNVHSSLCACPDAVFSSADHRLWPSLMMSNSWLPLWPTANAILHRFFYLYCHLRQASHLANASIISVYVSFLLSQLEKHIYLSVLMGGNHLHNSLSPLIYCSVGVINRDFLFSQYFQYWFQSSIRYSSA